MEKKIIEKLTDIYYYLQYGKLMPGFIHNVNGKITAVDSKLQITSMKTQMKIKKLKAKKDEMNPEVYESINAEYEDLLKTIDKLKQPMTELTGLIKTINEKVFNEGNAGIQMIDINGTIKSFDEFFKFYKRYKPDTEVIIDLEGNPFVKMEYRDIYLILYTIVKNAVDSTYSIEAETKQIRITTNNHSDHVDLTIFCNGNKITDENKLFNPLFTTKVDYSDIESNDEDPKGAGLDLYFLKMIMDKYDGYDYSLKNVEGGTEFRIKLLKK
jgi:signal transduction histidine kinase